MLNAFKIMVVIIIMSTTPDMLTKVLAAEKRPVQKRPEVQQGERPVAVITIRETKEATMKEYRINGVLRAIKVSPKNGFPAYYLIDREGSGEFEKLGPDVGGNFVVPQWILFEW